MKFDSNYHIHVGYYEEENDIEVTVYKVLDDDKWVVFLDEEQHNYKLERIISHYDFYSRYGYLIFTAEVEEITYELVLDRLVEWLKEHRIIE